MSVVRWKSLPPVRQDKYGYYLCRLCQQPCPGTERHWCSEACLRRFLTTSHGSFVRALLFERDGGVCAECGVNAAQMDAALHELKSDLLHPLLMSIHPMIVTTLRAEGWTNIKLRGRGSYPDAIKFTSCSQRIRTRAGSVCSRSAIAPASTGATAWIRTTAPPGAGPRFPRPARTRRACPGGPRPASR